MRSGSCGQLNKPAPHRQSPHLQVSKARSLHSCPERRAAESKGRSSPSPRTATLPVFRRERSSSPRPSYISNTADKNRSTRLCSRRIVGHDPIDGLFPTERVEPDSFQGWQETLAIPFLELPFIGSILYRRLFYPLLSP